MLGAGHKPILRGDLPGENQMVSAPTAKKGNVAVATLTDERGGKPPFDPPWKVAPSIGL